MIAINISSISCPKCGGDMSFYIADQHRYLCCIECQYIATTDRDATLNVDRIDYLTGEIIKTNISIGGTVEPNDIRETV